MGKDIDEEVDTIEDDEVFVAPVVDKRDSSIFENEEFTKPLETLRSEELYASDYLEEKVKNKQIRSLQYAMSLLSWLLFSILTAIIMYIVINEPDIIKKIVDKIF